MSENKNARKGQAKFISDQYEIKKLCAKDAMIKPVFLYPDENLESILKKLKKEHINACIVVTKDKKFIGEISDNDIIRLFLQQTKFETLVKILNIGYHLYIKKQVRWQISINILQKKILL